MNSNLQKPVYERSQCCWNCQAPGHLAKDCSKPKRLFCSHCLKSNVTTKNCGCILKKTTPRSAHPNYPTCPRAPFAIQSPFNITVGDETFRAFINTMESITRVGWIVATKAAMVYGVRRQFLYHDNQLTSEATIPMDFNNLRRNIKCRILEGPYSIIVLGTDALQCFGCELKLNGRNLFTLPACPVDRTHIHSDKNVEGPSRIHINPTRVQARRKTCKGIKNPINLNVDELFPEEDTNEPATSAKKTPEERNLPEPNPEYSKWSLLVLQEAQNDCHYSAMEYIMDMNDEELDDVLDLEPRAEDMKLG